MARYVKNNKYAETHTRETAIALGKKALKIVDDNCYFLSEVAEKLDTHRHVFVYLLQKFNEDPEVKDIIQRLYTRCESIVVRKAADRKIDNALGIFILKSYHGLMETSKTQHEVEVSDLANIYKKALSSNEKNPG